MIFYNYYAVASAAIIIAAIAAALSIIYIYTLYYLSELFD